MFWDELLPCLFSLPTFASLPTMHSGISRAALKATCCCLQDDAQGARLSLSLCGSPVPLEGECGAFSPQDPLLLLLWVRAALPSTKRWGEAPDGSCAVQVAENRHRLHREAVGSSLEISKSQLDIGLGTLLWVSLLEWGLDLMDPEVPSHLDQSVIL